MSSWRTKPNPAPTSSRRCAASWPSSSIRAKRNAARPIRITWSTTSMPGCSVQQVQLSHKAVNTLIFGLENVTVIWLGALAVLAGSLTVGMLYAFLSFKLLFLGRINALIDKLVEFNMLDLHAERIAEIALAEPEPRRACYCTFRPPSGDRSTGHLVCLRRGGQRVPENQLHRQNRRDGGIGRSLGLWQDHASSRCWSACCHPPKAHCWSTASTCATSI